MKIPAKQISFLVFLIGNAYFGAGQSDLLNHTSATPTHYLGWDDNTTFDLNIKHEGEYHINWFTFDEQRMRLTSAGLLGLGTTDPQNCFHIHDASGAGLNLTNNGTGSTGTDGMALSMTDVNF